MGGGGLEASGEMGEWRVLHRGSSSKSGSGLRASSGGGRRALHAGSGEGERGGLAASGGEMGRGGLRCLVLLLLLLLLFLFLFLFLLCCRQCGGVLRLSGGGGG